MPANTKVSSFYTASQHSLTKPHIKAPMISITIELNEMLVDFFKEQATLTGTSVEQRMYIVLADYAAEASSRTAIKNAATQ